MWVFCWLVGLFVRSLHSFNCDLSNKPIFVKFGRVVQNHKWTVKVEVKTVILKSSNRNRLAWPLLEILTKLSVPEILWHEVWLPLFRNSSGMDWDIWTNFLPSTDIEVLYCRICLPVQNVKSRWWRPLILKGWNCNSSAVVWDILKIWCVDRYWFTGSTFGKFQDGDRLPF